MAGGRFRDVTVVIPESMADCADNVTRSSFPDNFDDADFVVTANDDAIFGGAPWADRFGQCGARVAGRGGVKISYRTLQAANITTDFGTFVVVNMHN